MLHEIIFQMAEGEQVRERLATCFQNDIRRTAHADLQHAESGCVGSSMCSAFHVASSEIFFL